VSITRTAEELSIVSKESVVPSSVRAEGSWRCLRVAGELDFAMTGVLSSLTGPLSVAGIPVFVISTFDTDYLFVRVADFERAASALREAGHSVF
jgi:hypothetical protein